MIVKIYEASCDNCSTRLEEPAYTAAEAEEMMIAEGWIVKPKVGHFCSLKCAREAAKEIQ